MKGYIEVHLPEKAGRVTLHYMEVGEMQEPDMNAEYEHVVAVDEQNIGRITDLEAGTYQIQAFTDSGYEFMPSLVSVPMWNEEEKEMQYDITVLPKYTVQTTTQTTAPTTAPQTGDGTGGGIYGVLGLFSLIILAIISCHNRLKCGRMSHMYSKRRRT